MIESNANAHKELQEKIASQSAGTQKNANDAVSSEKVQPYKQTVDSIMDKLAKKNLLRRERRTG